MKLPFLTLLAGIFLCSTALGQCDMKVPAPVFTADTIPSSPSQTREWKPPATSLPKNFVTATATLFAQGLADPRDFEYRQIEVVIGSVWGGSSVCKFHGWVLPNQLPNQSQRFGIGWNGLIYPLVSVGETANISEDVLKLINQDEILRARYKIERSRSAFHRLQHATSEGASLSHETLLPLKACLLLRLGHTELAEKVWSAWKVGTDEGNNNLKDPYLDLSRDWAWTLFDRAVTSHMRGDDKLSLLTAKALQAIETSVEVTFLNQLPQLLADEERRVRENTDPRRQTLEEILRIKDPRVRVDKLIGRLDEVVAFQTGQPGGVSLSESEIVKALIAQGDAAAEPLVNVIENDTRLTRSVSFGRDFHYGRHLIGVHEAAYVALVQILKPSNFAVESEDWEKLRQGRLEDRRAVAARIRQHLKE